jgi:hypothetical protein
MLDSLLLTALGGVLGIAGTLAATIWQGRSARDAQREQNACEDRCRLATDRIAAYTNSFKLLSWPGKRRSGCAQISLFSSAVRGQARL